MILARAEPETAPGRALRELLGALSDLLYPAGRLAPLLGARWVEVKRGSGAGSPFALERGRGRDATRELALPSGACRVPHPLGRVPEGLLLARNSAGATVAEGEHTADYLSLTLSAASTLQILVI